MRIGAFSFSKKKKKKCRRAFDARGRRAHVGRKSASLGELGERVEGENQGTFCPRVYAFQKKKKKRCWRKPLMVLGDYDSTDDVCV